MRDRSSKVAASKQVFRSFVAILCSFLIVPGEAAMAFAQEQGGAQAAQPDKTLSTDELDSLVAPIALYPDSLLSQALVASTYPLEIVQLQQWLEANKNLKDKALTDAAMKQPWDPSVQAMAVLPDMVKQLAGNIQWTTDLGNAFLAQEKDVMDAVQRMRAKAKDKGNLKSSEQQKVETKVIENKETIIIQPSNPEVVYVPSYNPTVVYGAPAYPYPPVTYPPPGYYAAGMALSFGVGMMVGAAWGGGGWGCGWGGNNNVYINNNNNFVRNTNVQGGNRVNARGGNTTWQHNPQHRGAAPYSNRATANRYGGTARGDSLQNRQGGARNSGLGDNRGNGGLGNNRGNSGLGDNRGNGGLGDRNNGGGVGNSGNRGGNVDRGGNRPSAGNMDRSADRGGGGGGDRVGNRSVPDSSRGGGGGAFGGGSGSSARASSSRGSSSFSGGGRGGGGRGGGGGRRR